MALTWVKIGNLKGPMGPAGDAAAVGRFEALERDKWLRPPLPTSPRQDIWNLKTSGFTGILAADTAHLPVPVTGFVEVFAYGGGVTQRFTTFEATPRQFVASIWASGTRTDWTEIGGTPAGSPTSGDLQGTLAVVRDATGAETWLGARSSDGGPTEWAMTHIESRLGVGGRDSEDYLIAATDSRGNLTDLAIRQSDGQFADFVVERLRSRISGGTSTPGGQRIYADAAYIPGSDIFPVKTDVKRAAGWGSSSMGGIDSHLASFFGSKGATYFGGGKGGERGEHTAARMGAIPALVTVAGGKIPASGSVNITTSNMPLSGNLRAYAGTLAGVPGILAYRAAPAPASFIFTRSTSGAAVDVPAETPFIPDAVSYRDAVTLLWMGKNNFSLDNAEKDIVTLTDACFNWLAPLEKRCLVLGHFVDGDTPAGALERAQISAVNAAHQKRYGRLFVDVGAYLSSAQVWKDTGITPTQADLSAQAAGTKPDSLSADAGHMNTAAYTAVKNLIAARITELGWY